MHQADGPTLIVTAARTPIGKSGGTLSVVSTLCLGGGGSVAAAFERLAS